MIEQTKSPLLALCPGLEPYLSQLKQAEKRVYDLRAHELALGAELEALNMPARPAAGMSVEQASELLEKRRLRAEAVRALLESTAAELKAAEADWLGYRQTYEANAAPVRAALDKMAGLEAQIEHERLAAVHEYERLVREASAVRNQHMANAERAERELKAERERAERAFAEAYQVKTYDPNRVR